MSSGRDTIEAEVLDAAYAKHGGESAWSAFGDGRLNPAEILERIEEGDSSSVAARAVVVGVMLDLVLEGWAKNNDVGKVGENASRLAAAFGHRGGFRLVPLFGAVKKCGGWDSKPVVVKVLDSWFWDNPDQEDLGKRLLAIGRFFNHAELESWSVRGLARAFGESRTWTAKRVRKECNAPIEAAGGRAKATWQQGAGQREKSRAARIESFQKSKTKN
jgi:hypothetical protein